MEAPRKILKRSSPIINNPQLKALTYQIGEKIYVIDKKELLKK
jgi:hypothetical protein